MFIQQFAVLNITLLLIVTVPPAVPSVLTPTDDATVKSCKEQYCRSKVPPVAVEVEIPVLLAVADPQFVTST
jgi:hypothetical protein